MQRNPIQRNEMKATQRNATQCNAIQRNATQCNVIQRPLLFWLASDGLIAHHSSVLPTTLSSAIPSNLD
jgi:hypothetical protein